MFFPLGKLNLVMIAQHPPESVMCEGQEIAQNYVS